MYLGLEKEEIERCELNKEARTSLSKAATFQDQNAVHEIFSELRREDPVAWCQELDGGRGFWSVTKYDDIQFVSKNPKNPTRKSTNFQILRISIYIFKKNENLRKK